MPALYIANGLIVAPGGGGGLCLLDPPPPPAVSAGYTQRTLGPSPTLTAALYPFTFFASVNPEALQNGDGSLLLTGVNTLYNGSVCTAQKDVGKTNNWGGRAFGGGAYFESEFAFTGAFTGAVSSWPAFWMNDIEHMCNATALYQWPGQSAGYGDWQEVDIMEFDAGIINSMGIAAHNWYGTTGSGLQTHTSFGAVSIGAQNFSSYQKYGLLWIPATATTQGSFTWYFNNTSIGSVSWNAYNAGDAPPPVAGSSAYSISDSKHFCPIIGTSNTALPVTVKSLSVWQGLGASNLQQ